MTGSFPYETTTITLSQLRAFLAHVIAAENCEGNCQDLQALTVFARRFLSNLGEPVLRLIMDEKVYIHVELNDVVRMYVQCSDLFNPDQEDSETLSMSDIPSLLECLNKTRHYGHMLWVCGKRGMRPRTTFYKYMTPDERMLFDLAGPPREDTGLRLIK